jgi:hypothetical protein
MNDNVISCIALCICLISFIISYLIGRKYKLPIKSIETRPETGSIQFGDDWPGTFIRGDDSAFYSMALKELLDQPSVTIYPLQHMALRNLLSLLQSSEAPAKNAQQLKPYNECK